VLPADDLSYQNISIGIALMKDCPSNHFLCTDSTTLPVCKNQRIQRHQSLAAIATLGKSSME
jgi:hypothetical protein